MPLPAARFAAGAVRGRDSAATASSGITSMRCSSAALRARRSQRFHDRGQPAAGAGQVGGERRGFLAVSLERRPVLVVHPFELGFPVPHFAARLVDLQ